MTDATTLHPSIRRRMRRGRDVAYAAYLTLGLALSAAFALNRLPTSWWLYRAGAVVLSSPWVVLLMVVAGVLAMAASLIHRREQTLVLMAVLLAAGVPVLVMVPSSPTVRDHVASPYFVVATIAWLALPLRWFLHARRRWQDDP